MNSRGDLDFRRISDGSVSSWVALNLHVGRDGSGASPRPLGLVFLLPSGTFQNTSRCYRSVCCSLLFSGIGFRRDSNRSGAGVGGRNRLDDILNHGLLAYRPVACDGSLVVRVVMMMFVRVVMLRWRGGLARGWSRVDVDDLGDGYCRWGGDGGVNGSGSGHVDRDVPLALGNLSPRACGDWRLIPLL